MTIVLVDVVILYGLTSPAFAKVTGGSPFLFLPITTPTPPTNLTLSPKFFIAEWGRQYAYSCYQLHINMELVLMRFFNTLMDRIYRARTSLLTIK